ncbi:MAG: response regulator [Desulfobacterales bacterium]|nr:response regulator [Desulfobacterales bacterium]
MSLPKILLIDDEETNVRVLSMSLRAGGYQVITAYSGEEGLSVFEKESPPIILTDIKMPGMSGLEVLKNVKARQPDTEVIIITGHGDIDSTIEALQYGASDFISKPIRDQALSIALKRAGEKLNIRHQLKRHSDELEIMVQEMKRKSDFQARLIKNSNDGIVATDSDWRVIIFNPGAENIFGYSQAEMVSKIDTRDFYPPEVLALFHQEEKPKKDADWHETMIRTKSGEKIPVRFSGTVMYEKNRIVGSVAFFQDLRKIKRLERELIQSEKLAAIGQTVAGMAHGIKNILHGFKGGGYLMNVGIDRDDPVKLKAGFKMLQKNIDRTSALVMDLLSYAKEREPEYQDCTPNEIVGDVCELLAKTAEDNDVQIVKNLSPAIGRVSMDPRTVQRALVNLVSNAIDACVMDNMADKQHRVDIKTTMNENNHIEFEVTDNGSGMTDEVKAKLFTSFFSTKGAGGTGLGLLVTRKLVEECGGSIAVASQLGVGTTFTVRLPYREIEA